MPDKVRPEVANRICGLRTEFEGLREFMQMGSNETGSNVGASILRARGHQVMPPQEMTVCCDPHMVVRTRRGRGTEAQDNEIVADSVVLESVGPKRSFREYWEEQRPIASLLSVAFWREPRVFWWQVILCQGADATRERGARTDGLLTSRATHPGVEETLRLAPLFRYTDQTLKMFDIWSTIWNQKPRAVRPLTNLPGIRGALPETRLLAAGTGLEALGYYMALDETDSKHSAKDEPLAVKLDRVANSLPIDMRELLGEESTKKFRDAYMSVKHADCDMPPSQELNEAYAWGIRLFRLWTASQVGVPASACVKDALVLPTLGADSTPGAHIHELSPDPWMVGATHREPTQ